MTFGSGSLRVATFVFVAFLGLSTDTAAQSSAFNISPSVALLVSDISVRPQDPTPTPSPAPASNTKTKTDDAPKTSAAASPAPRPEDIWHQEELTGDWGGTRSRWKEHGLEMKFTLTGFVQGTAAGGLRRDTEWNGKFETEVKMDLGKLWGWKWWSAETKMEYRFGGPVLGGTGAINIVNTDMVTPGPDGSVVAVTALNFTRLFPINLKKGELVAV